MLGKKKVIFFPSLGQMELVDQTDKRTLVCPVSKPWDGTFDFETLYKRCGFQSK